MVYEVDLNGRQDFKTGGDEVGKRKGGEIFGRGNNKHSNKKWETII